MTTGRLSLNPSRVALTLGVVAFALVVLSTVFFINYMFSRSNLSLEIAKFFYVDNERNLPTLFSSLLLLFAALLLTFITVTARKRKEPNIIYWAVLSAGFLFMAADELLSFHEELTLPMRNLTGNDHLGVLFYGWVAPLAVLAFIIILFFLKFWWRLPSQTRLTFFVAAVTYLGGCIGFEMITSWYVEQHGFLSMTLCLIATTEETLEMTGAIIFIWGLLTYIEDNYREEAAAFLAFAKTQIRNVLPAGRR